MVISTAKMNARQFLQLGEDPVGVWLELVNGEVAIGPSQTPSHSFCRAQLATVLGGFVDQHRLGEVYMDVNTVLDEFNVRRPDVLFFNGDHLDRIGEEAMEGPPDLAIEVISPSSIAVDREDKSEQYRAAKVEYYWIVDPTLRTFEGWELKRGKYVATGRAHGVESIHLPPFKQLKISLKDLWRKQG